MELNPYTQCLDIEKQAELVANQLRFFQRCCFLICSPMLLLKS